MHPILNDLNWRYSAKKYDAEKKINDDTLDIVLESVRLTPSSLGLQPFRVLVINNPIIRAELVHASYNQRQVLDASHLLVFCAYRYITDSDIENHITNTAKIQEVSLESLNAYKNGIFHWIHKLSDEEVLHWTAKQAYIALGQLLLTCASLHIDATPMEGVNLDQYDSILGLEGTQLRTTLVCPIGFRHPDDLQSRRKKVRKSRHEFIEVVE